MKMRVLASANAASLSVSKGVGRFVVTDLAIEPVEPHAFMGSFGACLCIGIHTLTELQSFVWQEPRNYATSQGETICTIDFPESGQQAWLASENAVSLTGCVPPRCSCSRLVPFR